MGVKIVLRALFLAYALTGVCLLVLAGLVFWMDIGTGAVTVGIILIYVISCMAGGFLAGKIARREKYRWGALSGLAYFLLILFRNCSVPSQLRVKMHSKLSRGILSSE